MDVSIAQVTMEKGKLTEFARLYTVYLHGQVLQFCLLHHHGSLITSVSFSRVPEHKECFSNHSHSLMLIEQIPSSLTSIYFTICDINIFFILQRMKWGHAFVADYINVQCYLSVS